MKDLADELVRNLGAFFDEDALVGLSFGIREMMTNAIEHGNLAIGYEEKTRAMSQNAYLELLADRRGDPRFSARRVTVQYRLAEDQVEFEIEDQGNGFDTGSIARAKNGENLYHGRGILLTRDHFDEVLYNERGNQVRLKKRLPRR